MVDIASLPPNISTPVCFLLALADSALGHMFHDDLAIPPLIQLLNIHLVTRKDSEMVGIAVDTA